MLLHLEYSQPRQGRRLNDSTYIVFLIFFKHLCLHLQIDDDDMEMLVQTLDTNLDGKISFEVSVVSLPRKIHHIQMVSNLW